MYKQILEALQTRFSGVGENILGRYAQKLAKTVTTAEQVKTATDGVTLQQIIDSYADSRATEAQQTAVTNYEKKHGLKDGKPVEATPPATPPTPPAPKGGEDMPAWAKALVESNKALSEQVKAMQGEKITTARRKEIAEITSKLPASLQRAYERTPVDTLSQEDFEKLKGEITTEVEGIANETAAHGAVIGTPLVHGGSRNARTGGNAKEASDAEVDAVAERLGI